MKSRTRSRKPASIGSNHSSRRPTAISASEPRTGNFVLLLVMAWSPPAHNAGIVWVSAPGDYATFNSNHTPDGTNWAGCLRPREVEPFPPAFGGGPPDRRRSGPHPWADLRSYIKVIKPSSAGSHLSADLHASLLLCHPVR